MKILIADDREENLYLLETLLKGNGYEVISAKNGVEALEKLEKEPVGLIISDILMPKMDGFRLCSKCKSDDKLREIPFIFYTATYTDKKAERFALSLGAQRFVIKPEEPDNFLKIIKDSVKESAKGIRIPSKIPVEKEVVDYLREYNEVLVEKLEKKVLDLERTRDVLTKSELNLKERLKELNCLYEMTKIVEIPNISLDGIFSKTVDKLPSAWQYSDISCARIIFEGREFKTTNFKETKWKQSADIKVSGKKVGVVEVYYLEEKPEIYDGPFLKEERNLIDAIIERLGRIVERKRAEEQTKELREYLQLQVNRMPIGLIFWDKEFRAKTWNPAATKIFGFTEEEALGRRSYDIIVPKEAKSHVDDVWRRLLEEGLTAYSINKNITKDGLTILCDWANVPLKEADGTVIGVLSMVQDITVRKRAEEELKARVKELEEFHEVTVGRELKMKQMEAELEQLRAKPGEKK